MLIILGYNSNMKKWKKISSEIAFENKWVRLRLDKVLDPLGRDGSYSVIDKPDEAVAIIPIDEKDNIYLIRLWRYPLDSESLEIPMGRCDGQNHREAAIRELQEETGLISKKLTYLGYTHPISGLSGQKSHTYLAQDLILTENHEKEEEGIEEVIKMPLKKVLEMIKNDEMKDGETITAILKTLLFLKKI